MNNPTKLQPQALEGLEKRIGHTFKNKEYAKIALTHSSFSNEMKAKGQKTSFNERLEFLGDSVLSIVVSSYIFDKYKNKQEGDLTKIRAAVVCEKALAKYANAISLGDYMYLGHGEIMNNGRKRPSIIADAFEALLAAIYLDTDETFDVVETFLIPFIAAEIDHITATGVFIDYKTALQQVVQQVNGEILEYVCTEESGPAHSRYFKVEARLNSNIIGRGEAKTKREAEQQAAHEALILFGEAE